MYAPGNDCGRSQRCYSNSFLPTLELVIHNTMQPATLEVDRDQASFPYTKEIAKPFGKLDVIIAWCKQELVAEWRWQVIEPSSDIRPGTYRFFFDSERDMCAFTMQWS